MQTHFRNVAAILAIGLAACGLLCQQAQAQGPITGNITFAGTVNLDTSSASNATMVILNGWHGLAAGDKPQRAKSRRGFYCLSHAGSWNHFSLTVVIQFRSDT